MPDIALQKLFFEINLELHMTWHVDHFLAFTSMYHSTPSVYTHYLSNENHARNDSDNYNDESKNHSNYHSIIWRSIIIPWNIHFIYPSEMNLSTPIIFLVRHLQIVIAYLKTVLMLHSRHPYSLQMVSPYHPPSKKFGNNKSADDELQ